MPPSVLSIIDDPAHHLEDYEERVKRVISHARLWGATEAIPKREHYW